MAKKTTAQKLRDLVSSKPTPQKQNASSLPKNGFKVPSVDTQENYKTGIKGKKSPKPDQDSILGKLETRLKSNGLTMKVDHAHHLNITILRETPDHTTQISGQTGENLTQSEADFLHARAITELLGGGL